MLKNYFLLLLLLPCYFSLFTLTSAQAPSSINNSLATQSTLASPSAVPNELPPNSPPPDTGINLLLSPSVLLIHTEPGIAKTYTLKVKNNNPQPEALQLEVKKVVENSRGGLDFIDLNPDEPILQWIQFNQQKFLVNPGTWFETQMTFTPDLTAKLGYYFAIVFNRQQSAQKSNAGQAQVIAAPAIMALADVTSAETIRQLELVSFTTTKKWYDFLPVVFDVTIKNTGNIHLNPYGNIFIDQGSTKDVSILKVNQTAGQILPGMTRTFTASWTDGFPLWVTDPENPNQLQLDWNWQNLLNFRIGKFTGILAMAYDNSQRDVPLEYTLDFWVFPWQIIALAAITSLVLIIGVLAIFKILIQPFRSHH